MVVVEVVLVLVVVGPLVVVALVVGGDGAPGMALGPLVDIPVPLLGVGGQASCVVPGRYGHGNSVALYIQMQIQIQIQIVCGMVLICNNKICP